MCIIASFLLFLKELYELIVVAPQLLIFIHQLEHGEHCDALNIEAARRDCAAVR